MRSSGEWTSTDLAYLAGLLDGEGYFNQRDSGSLVVRMASRPITEWAKATFGGRLHTRAGREAHHKLLDEWVLERQRVLYDLLPQLMPYLKHKQEECACLWRLVAHAVDNKPARRNGGSDPARDEAWNLWYGERERLQAEIRATR